MKKLVVSLLVLLVTLLGFNVWAGEVVLQPVCLTTPINTAGNYDNGAVGKVDWALAENGFEAFSVGDHLTADMIARSTTDATQDDKILWFSLFATDSSGEKLSLRNVVFEETSFEVLDKGGGVMENRNSLQNEHRPAVNAIYGERARGVRIVNSTGVQLPFGSASSLTVNKLVYIGMQSKYFVFGSSDPTYKTIDDVNNYIGWSGWVGGFRIQFTVKLLDDSGNVITSAKRTLYVHPPVIVRPQLSVRRVGDGDRIAVTLVQGPEDQNMILQSALNANGPWGPEANLLLGGSVTYPRDGLKFFRVLLEERQQMQGLLKAKRPIRSFSSPPPAPRIGGGEKD